MSDKINIEVVEETPVRVEVTVDENSAQTAKDAADRAEQILEDKLDRGGYTGTAKDIVDSIKVVEDPDVVLKYGDIETDALHVHVAAAAFKWRLNHVDFLTPPVYNKNLDAAADGNYRTDVLLGNTAGGYQILKGEEDPVSAGEPTNLPNGTIKLGLINVFGTVITGIIIDVNGFITKEEKNFIRMSLIGDIDKIEIDNRSYLKFEPGMLSLGSVNISDSKFLYHGKFFILKFSGKSRIG